MIKKSEINKLSGSASNRSEPILGFISSFFERKGFASIREVVSKTQNKGFVDKTFEIMMREVGWRSGEAWCAYFVKVFLMQFYSFDREWINKHLTGSAAGNFYAVRNLNRLGDRRYVVVTTNTPQLGDVACWGVVGRGHTGIVIDVITPTRVKTAEGNTNLGGAREGDGVRVITRNMVVGQGSMKLIGYFRRNFTKEEMERLYFDEAEQTLKLK